jgi:hypothetical protein
VKNKFVYLATVALMANGMIFAHTIGDLPAAREGKQQSGSAVNSNGTLPGVVSTQQTQNAGTSPKGQAPGTGVQSGQVENASPNRISLPGTDTTAAPLLSKRPS